MDWFEDGKDARREDKKRDPRKVTGDNGRSFRRGIFEGSHGRFYETIIECELL
jgi:hypothetical protein